LRTISNRGALQINIIGDLKSAADKSHDGNGFHQDLHHVESIGNSGITQHPEPFFGAADDAILLPQRDSMVRRPKRVSGTSLNFHENQRRRAAIAADQVNFATPFRPKIFVQYAIAVFPKVFCGNRLPLLAERKVDRNAAATELSQPAPDQAAFLQSTFRDSS